MEQTVARLLEKADIMINGNRPWDMQVHTPKVFDRIISGGSLALGESYMDGWWSCEALDQFFHNMMCARLDKAVIPLRDKIHLATSRFLNMQTKFRSRKVAEKHYNLEADLFMSFLDPYNQYTCGYFKDTDDLDTAQIQKLDLICRKLQLKSGDQVLDIGCGWGGFAKYAAETYGCHVTGISISDAQIAYAREYCAGLPVTIVKSDYRDFQGTFDKILVCGMIEHVGHKNYRRLMSMAHRCLDSNGLFLLHTIGGNESVTTIDPWIKKYIFPNTMLPSPKQITKAAEGLFVLVDWHNFRSYYDKTLMAWHRNFAENWHRIKEKYGDRFYRMWCYYLLSCAGSFRCNKNQLWQIVFSKRERALDYQSIR